MNRHDFKNLSYFLDTKKGAADWWGEVQIHPLLHGEADLYASDGKKLARITIDLDLDMTKPATIPDGAAFLKEAAKTSLEVQSGSNEETIYAGDIVFRLSDVPINRNYRLLEMQALADSHPIPLDRLGFFSPHAASLGMMKTDKGKPAIIQLGFRRNIVTFAVTDSTCAGIISSNSLLTEEAQ